MRRYGGSYEYVMQMDCEEGMEMINYAVNEQTEERLMDRWIAVYQDRMSFDEFKEKLGIGTDSAKEENINVEDILDKVKGILGG